MEDNKDKSKRKFKTDADLPREREALQQVSDAGTTKGLEEKDLNATLKNLAMTFAKKSAIPVRLTRDGLSDADSPEVSKYKTIWKALSESRNGIIIFSEYKKFIDKLLSRSGNFDKAKGKHKHDEMDDFLTKVDSGDSFNHSLLTSSYAYQILKVGTEMFVRRATGIARPPFTGLPSPLEAFILQEVEEFSDASQQGETRILPKLELIWSYWHDEGLLTSTMNAISRRFQNIRNGQRDPLANLTIDPLRPLSQILWGYVQDTQHRLTIRRRYAEYIHQYGLKLFGRDSADFIPADDRANFIGAFHDLLYKCTDYYNDANDLTRIPDGSKVLNSLREVHRALTEGMHNQYGDLPFTSRVEMLMEQYILSRREIREFLRGRLMVAYAEPWMSAVDHMKTLQGWPGTSVNYHRELAIFAEQLLISVRFIPWTQIAASPVAGAWALSFRDIIQRYIQSYQAVTSVDVSAEPYNEKIIQNKSEQPGALIRKKHLMETKQKALAQ